jgi:8-oxo-dGTP pyrophosphatase MutT (NUDIX family)
VDALSYYLAALRPGPEEIYEWPGGVRLRTVCYLGDELPPPELVTSVRGIVLRENQVLVVRDPESMHILPGGRRNAGETLEETLRREVLEETGWQLATPQLLGIIWLRHLTPRPPDHPYPYPDFLQLVYCAQATHYLPECREIGGYEVGSSFYPLAELASLPLSEGQRFFLRAACRR